MASHSHAVAPSAQAPSNRARAIRLIARLVKWALFALVVYFVGRELLQRLGRLSWSQVRPDALLLAGAIAIRFVPPFLGCQTRYILLSGMGAAPRRRVFFAAVWISELGKYLPGKFASVLGGAWLLRREGVTPQSFVGMALMRQALTAVLGLMVSVPLVLWEPIRVRVPLAWLWCLLLLCGGAVCLHPRVFFGLGNFLLRRLRVPPLENRWRASQYAAPLGIMVFNMLIGGLGTWLLVRAFVGVSFSWFPVILAGSALAGTAGFLAVFAPGGLGVREGILVAVLEQIIPPAQAALVAVTVRAVQILMELALAGVGWVMLRRMGAAAPVGPRQVPPG